MARSLRPFTRRRRVLGADHPRHAIGATSPTTAGIPEITPDVELDSLALHGIDGLGLARARTKDTFARPPPPSRPKTLRVTRGLTLLPNGRSKASPPVLGIGQARR
jgi:hypothetical protein